MAYTFTLNPDKAATMRSLNIMSILPTVHRAHVLRGSPAYSYLNLSR